jgi:hypothetical protein
LKILQRKRRSSFKLITALKNIIAFLGKKYPDSKKITGINIFDS